MFWSLISMFPGQICFVTCSLLFLGYRHISWQMLQGRGGKECPLYNKQEEANWISYILCRNCPLEHVTEGTTEGIMEVKGKQGRKHEQLVVKLRKMKRTCKL